MSTLTHFEDYARKSNPRAALVRIEFEDAQGYGNQRRHDMRIGAQPGYVNTDLTYLNRVLVEPCPTAQIKRLSKDRRSLRITQRAMKKNAGIAISGLIGFGIEAQPMFDALDPDVQDAALRDLVDQIAAAWNTTLTGLVLHRDETAPHAHFSLCGYDTEGEPLSNLIKRGQLHELQTMTHTVLKSYMPDLERGRTRVARLKAGAQQHEVVNRSVAELHHDLPLEIAEKQEELTAIKDALDAAVQKLEKNERLTIGAHSRANENEQRAAKAAKNLEHYLARAEAAKTEIDALERRRIELQRDIQDKQAKIKADQEAAAQDRAAAERARQDSAALQRRLEGEQSALAEREAAVQNAEAQAHAAQAEAERVKAQAQKIAAQAAQTAVEAVAGVIEGTITYNKGTKKWIVPDANLRERLRPVFASIRPALERVNSWWDAFKTKIEKAPSTIEALLKQDAEKTLDALNPPEEPPDAPNDTDSDPGRDGPG